MQKIINKLETDLKEYENQIEVANSNGNLEDENTILKEYIIPTKLTIQLIERAIYTLPNF